MCPVKMNVNENVPNKPVALRLRIMHVSRMIIASFMRILFTLYYGTEGKKIPPIKEEILKVPALEIARRIRNKEVSSLYYLKNITLFISSMMKL